jgi:hypothetical protein
LSAVTAAIVSFIAFQWLATEPLSDSAAAFDAGQPNRPSIEPARPVFSVTDALLEDTWVDASRTAGSDQRTLTDASTSMCYLTKVEISGVQGPDDTNSCAVEIDDFTGFWQLIATVEEGGRSEVRCNARCLSWNSRGTE